MPEQPPPPPPVDVLVAHQRHSSHACLCGFDILGYSHCQHQLDALAAAGYTVIRSQAVTDLAVAMDPSGVTYDEDARDGHELVAGWANRVRALIDD